MLKRFMAAALISLPCASVARSQETITRLGSFQTPTGNIHCEEWSIAGPRRTELRCDVLESTARRPKPPRDCELDYGYAFMLSARRRAWLLCGGDTIADTHHVVLAYGEIWRGTGVTCESTPMRLRCVNRDGHGFELSKRVQRMM